MQWNGRTFVVDKFALATFAQPVLETFDCCRTENGVGCLS